MKVLEANQLKKRFGGLQATKNVTMAVNEGEILGLIGSNGAGKTTLFNLLSGSLKVDSGEIRFKGDEITRLKPHQITRKGIARTFQSVMIFPTMSVLDHVKLGCRFGREKPPGASEAEEEAKAILAFVGLADMGAVPAGELILSHQKRLEIARALATKPDLLLLDEVMAGLTPTEVAGAMELVLRIKESGVTILMIEHVMKAIMNICNRVVVLNQGTMIAEGTPEEIAKDRTVIEVYLGEAAC